MKKAILDGAVLAGDRTNAHVHLQRALDLPDYYGCNLDALWACLSERSTALELILSEQEALCANLPDYGLKFLRILEDAARENPQIQVKFR